MPIVWEHPDGTVSITVLDDGWLAEQRRPGETTAEAVARLALVIQERTPHLAGATMTLVRSADLPATRARRRAWRLNKALGRVVEGPEVL